MKEEHALAEDTVDSRLFEFDVLRSFAIILVVLIHALAHYFDAFEGVNLTVLTYWTFISVAVPSFIYLSGFFLYAKKNKDFIYFLKKIKRIFIPYFIWSVIFYIIFTSLSYGPMNFISHAVNFLYKLITGTVVMQYYFIILILEFYIIFMLSRKYITKNIILTFSIGLILTLIGSFVRYGKYNIPLLSSHHFLVWAYFFVLGMAISKNYDKIKLKLEQYKYHILIIAGAAFVLNVAESRFYGVSILNISSLIFYSLFFISLPYLISFGKKFFIYISSISFGIYLIHEPFMSMVYNFLPIANGYLFIIVLSLMGLIVPVIVISIAKVAFKDTYVYLFG